MTKRKTVAVAKRPEGRLLDKVVVEDGRLVIEGGQPSKDAMDRAFCTSSPDFVSYALMQISNVLRTAGSDDLTVPMNAAVAMLQGIAPTNELEAMLAAQMIATHHLTMTVSFRAITAEGLPQYQAHGNLATKFARTFTAQIEALSKLRRGGEQVVRHVHVNEGGQALIAGTVHTGGSGNG